MITKSSFTSANKTNISNVLTIELKFIEQDQRKRTLSAKTIPSSSCSMSVMMKEDSSYVNNAVVPKSKALLFKELTCMVMQSSNYIKTLPEVDLAQLESKKVKLPEFKNAPHLLKSSNKSKLLDTLLFFDN